MIIGARVTRENVDFVDAYLAERGRCAMTPVASFDRDIDRLGVERM